MTRHVPDPSARQGRPRARRRHRRRVLAGLGVPVVLGTGIFVAQLSADAGSDPLGGMSRPVYQRVNPTSAANLVTIWADEAQRAASGYGFTTDLGTPFRVAASPASGLTAVHRLYRARNADFTWASAGSSGLAAALSAGYVDQGTTFYAVAAPWEGRTRPVRSYVRNAMHRLALPGAGATLVAQGWTLEGTAFHVPAAGAGPTASTASMASTASTASTASRVSPSGTPSTGAVGSVPVGSASYPVPTGAVHVSTSGDDAAAGTAVSPVRTLARGVALAPAGGTVVVHEGVYRESVTIQGKAVTLQNAPGEAVWLDGSQPVSGWVADGSGWRKDGWTTRFDSSPTYTQGKAEDSRAGWRFVDTKNYPMAAHPDQVFVDGTALRQVSARDQVTTGTFYLDTATSALYVGTDPSGRPVAASTVIKALTIRSAGSVVRGIGVRRFAPSVFHMGAVTVEATGVHLQNVVIADSATTGISLQQADAVLDHVTVQDSGLLGIHGNHADRVLLSSVLSTRNNTEHFNTAPVSGGVKLGLTRGVTVERSSISGNYGHGFWEDMSCYDSVLRDSAFSDNTGDGVFLEISAKAVVGNNVVARNKGFGIKINNTADVQIWNNTVVRNDRALNLVQDARRNTDRTDPAFDSRRPFPDPQMPWTLGPVAVHDNVIADSVSGADCLLCVEDYSKQRSAEQMGITADANVYHRTGTTSPTWIAVWSRADVDPDPFVFTTLAALTARTGQEKTGREVVGQAVVDASGNLTSAATSLADTVATPLPADVASAIGRTAGTRQVGAR